MKRNKKALLLLTLLGLLGFFLSTCNSKQISANDPRGHGFAGSAQCRQCHESIYDQYLASTHYNSTQAATRKNTLGSFQESHNGFIYNDSISIRMEQRDSGMYQVAYVNDREVEAHRFDILFGVKHAQTSLYWKDNRSFELPVSFYQNAKSWGTSPGFSATHINFNRFIGVNCFECHSSYIGSQLNASVKGIEEVLDKNTLIYGIDCERCHGPALNHVNFHLDNNSKEGKYLVKMASLTRQQQLDVCAVCHSGNNKIAEKSTFRFGPGDTLAHFFTIWPGSESASSFDVHGNQYQLLSQSQCFLKTRTLNCSTCHNPHSNAGSDLKTYSAKCQSCHQQVIHSFAKENTAARQLENNCIDCHMPSQPSQAITFQLSGSKEISAYQLRTHKIAVYASEKRY